MFKIKIDVNKLTNGRHLPDKPEAGLICYEMVVSGRGGRHNLTRIQFLNEKEINLTLLNQDTEIDEREALENSMNGTVVRYEKLPIQFHFYKIARDVHSRDGEPTMDIIGYKRHIQEITSADQDVCEFEITSEGTVSNHPDFISKIEFISDVTKVKHIDDIVLDKSDRRSMNWLTQRKFYGSAGVTSSSACHRENLTRIIVNFLDRYKDKKFNTFCEMLVEFGKTITLGRVKYECDEEFAKTGVPTDAGDTLIELTTTGDCEDFAHFYMRNFRVLSRIYKYVLEPSSDLYTKCKLLETDYVAFNYICSVTIGNNPALEFHSTMLFIPKDSSNNVISYEVTDPKMSYTLPSSEFTKWHKKHYVILEPICIHRLNRTGEYKSKPIEKLTWDDLFLYNL